MNVDYRDRNKPITAEDLIRRYNFEEISKIKKATESNKKGLDKTNAIMDEFIEVTTENIQELQDQVDGNITTWFFSGVPTLLNEPAVNWTTDDEKINHLGDLYYDQETGYAYRFQMTNDEFSWYKLTDADVTEALAIANAAKDTADAKRRVFVTQPTPPYDVGDIWLKDDQELYRCRSARESGSYNPSDWIIGTKYTDDSYAMSVESVLNAFMDVVTTDYATKVLLETTADSINANVATNAQEIHNITTTISNVSGNPIEIEDAINTNPINFQLDGNTEQNGTPTPSSPVSVNNVTGRQEIDIVGKNLLNYNLSTNGSILNNSISEQLNDDIYAVTSSWLPCKPNTSYTISGGKNRARWQTKDINGTITFVGDNLNTIITNSTAAYIRVYYYYNLISGGVDPQSITDVQIEEGNATDFEPYIGKQYEINLGKNLFDDTIVQGVVGNTGVNDTPNRIRNTKFINVNPGQTYSLSFETTNGINQYNISYFTNASFPRTSETGWINTSFTIPSGINYIMISLSKSSGQNIVPTDISNVQLEEGSKATSYSPYKIPIELCKIGDYQDYLFKLNNKWYIHKEIGKVVLDGSIDAASYRERTNTNIFSFKNVVNNLINGSRSTLCFSNYFKAVDMWNTDEEGMFVHKNSNESDYYIYLSINKSSASNISNMSSWLSTHNTSVYYVLATATDTEITDTELINQLNAITLLDGYNHIFATDELVDSVNVDYYRKTPLSNTYVNKTEMQSNLELTSNEIIATTSQNIENSYNQTQEDLNTNYYKKEVVDQLVLNSASGLTNTFSEAGGNNILRNTNFSATEVLETNQLYEYWYGNVVRISNNNSSNGISILLQNDTLYQIQNGIANGNYTLSFYYKKLNPVAECKVVINDKEYELTSENYTLFQTGINNINPIEIHTNNIQLSFISDADNSCEIYDIMLNIGSVKLAYSQNQNETTTSTVNISKGITISSSDRNVKLSATADGIRVKNVNTNETVTDFTETGMTTKSAKITDAAEIVGIYRQKVGNQIWDSLL